MTKPTVRLELERTTDEGYEVDEIIRGAVVVEVDREVDGTVDVKLELVTTALVGPARSPNYFGSEVRVHAGPFLPGQPNRIPFEIPAPEAPADYDGHIVQWHWHILARVKIRALDAVVRDSRPLGLRYKPSDWLKVKADPPANRELIATRNASTLIIESAMLVIALGLGGVGLWRGTLWMTLVGGIGALIMALLVWVSAGTYRLQGVVGNMQLSLEPIANPDGPPLHEVTLWTLPKAPIDKAKITFMAEERAEWGREPVEVRKGVSFTEECSLTCVEPGTYKGKILFPHPSKVALSLNTISRLTRWAALAEVELRSNEQHDQRIPIRAYLAADPPPSS